MWKVFGGIVALTGAFPQKYNVVDPTKIDTEALTNDVSVTNTALGSCSCDITFGSCDAYCCCDNDCAADILTVWKSNYDFYCAKNFLGQYFRPTQKCI